MEAEEIPTPKYRIPKKSARAPEVTKGEEEEEISDLSRDMPGTSRSFRDEMLPAETPSVVRPKTKEVQATVTEETESEMTTMSRESESQFMRDLAAQWS